MDYEKKYKDALERARKLRNEAVANDYTSDIEDYDTIFPELAESEDERIRKDIIEHFKYEIEELSNKGEEYEAEVEELSKYIAYLERQKDINCLACDQHLKGYVAGRKVTEEEKQKEPKPAGWKPQPESLEALMYAIEGKWEMIKPTSYLSRRLEDLYEGLVNSYNVNEVYLDELPRVASAGDVEALKELKRKIDVSMEQKEQKPISKPKIYDSMDDLIADALIEMVEESDLIDRDKKNRLVWIERHRAKPAEWSGEDETAFGDLMWCIEQARKSAKDENDMGNVWFAENWVKNRLKSLRPQPKQEWSEEEKDMLNRINSCIRWAMNDRAFGSCKRLIGDKEGVKLQDFLRSIAKPCVPQTEGIPSLPPKPQTPNGCLFGGLCTNPLRICAGCPYNTYTTSITIDNTNTK